MYDEENRGNPRNDSEILDLLVSCSSEFTPTYVFLDGLDECTTDQQHAIIELIIKFSSLESPMKVFLTSQPQLIHLVAQVEPKVCQEISASASDLKIYILQKLANSYPDLEEVICKVMLEDADGMYVPKIAKFLYRC